MGCLLRRLAPKARIIFINLGRTLFFDAFYTIQSFPDSEHKLIRNNDDYSNDFNYVEAESVFNTALSADVFVNIASMQEMNPEVIAEYFNLIRNQKTDAYFYCCNRVEKTLIDGTVIRFSDYDWRSTDDVLIDELCPWHQEFPIVRPPFILKFDGQVQHKLIKIKSSL